MAKLKPNQFFIDNFLITERPILFQTDMVKAVLEDWKTQTRREIKGQPTGDQAIDLKEVYNHNPEYIYEVSPYGKPGDLLWVRETCAKIETRVYYKADLEDVEDFKEIHQVYGLTKIKWKPSIHMPKEAARIWLMIEDIYPERLKDISHKDAIAEGIKELKVYPFAFYKDYLGKNDGYQHPIFSFNSLWISINGRESFDANPWVWVIKFRVLSKTGRPSNETILASRLSILASKEGKEVPSE